jgi:tripartite-type tricarboxylate transporter receptor subunit TctC
MFSNLGPAMPFIKGGKMKALMLTANRPAPQLPDVPIGAKVGIPQEVTSWQALAAPAGTPPAIIQRLNEIAVRGMNAPDVKERMATQAFDIVANSRRRVQLSPEEGSGAVEEGGEGFGRGDGLSLSASTFHCDAMLGWSLGLRLRLECV